MTSISLAPAQPEPPYKSESPADTARLKQLEAQGGTLADLFHLHAPETRAA